MLAFSVEFKSGVPMYEQVVFAVKKAMISGQLRAGEKFPSVREMSKELKINPNTAQKVVAHLVREKLLTIEPGKGSFVNDFTRATDEKFDEVLVPQIEQLVVEAKRLSIDQDEILKAIQNLWNKEQGE